MTRPLNEKELALRERMRQIVAQRMGSGKPPAESPANRPQRPLRAEGEGRGLSAAVRATWAAEAQEYAQHSAARVASAEPAPGLVNISTSQTASENPPEVEKEGIDIDPQVSRLKKMAFRVRQAAGMHTRAHPGWSAAMFTFTVAKGERVGANDFRDCLQNFRNWAYRKLAIRHLPYVWCAEIQEQRARNGAHMRECVHYHLLIWLPPELKRKANRLEARGLKASGVLPKPDQKGWWSLGSTERDWVRKNAVAYISKYLTKGTEFQFPKGTRLHGAGGFHDGHRQERHFSALPAWLRKQIDPTARCARVLGGGWLHRQTGETFTAPYTAVFMGTFIRLFLREAQCSDPPNLLPNLPATAS